MRWLVDNLSSFLLAFGLALAVWVAAVSSEDPVQENVFPAPTNIEVRGMPEGLLIVEDPPSQAQLTLLAPQSVWEQLTSADLHVWIDLTGLEEGEHRVPIQTQVDRGPAQVVSVRPGAVTLRLEPAASRDFPISVIVSGEPAIGFRALTPAITPAQATVEGPASAVNQVARLVAEVSLTGRRQNFGQDISVIPVDSEGSRVAGVEVRPNTTSASVAVEPLGGYRSVVVIPRIVDEVESGYQPTQITVSPTLVTVFSSDPAIVNALGGFVETQPISLQGATTDFERRVALDLPSGVTVVGDQSVTVRVGITPIEGFITVTTEVEIQGLAPGLYAQASPAKISLILAGPVAVLDKLRPEDVRVLIDVSGLEAGAHQVSLTEENVFLPEVVSVQTILPETIEVSISTTPPPSPTPTPTPTPGP